MHSQYSVVLVGCGAVAQKHLKALQQNQKRLRLSGLLDRSMKAAERFIKEQKLPANLPVATDLEALITDGKPDIVAITSPSGSHYSLARTALSNRIHTILEKPMTLAIEEARELADLAVENDVLIAMGHIYRYFPLVGLIRQDIRDGKLGRVLTADVKVRWGHDQAYYDRSAWRGSWQSDGGALMNQSVHACDLMCWLMGELPLTVNGRIARLKHKLEAEDYGSAIFTMESGAMLTLEGTTVSGEKNKEASFYLCTEQAIFQAGLRNGKPYFHMCDREGKSLTRKYLARQLAEMRKNGGLIKNLRFFKNPHSAIYRDLVYCLDSGDTPIADATAGLNSVEHMLAVYQSALHEGKAVDLPLSNFELSDMTGFFERKQKI